LNRSPALDVIDFRSTDKRTVRVSSRYYSAQLSPARDRLLLSGVSLDPSPAIATLDVPDLTNEKLLPVQGSDARWLSDRMFLFVRKESELWGYQLGEPAPVRLFAIELGRSRRVGSFATPPVVSASGRLIAWGFPTSDEQAPKLRTVVVDLERGEYRLLEGWWHNVQWLE
jgi:hypothetical protein